MNMLCGLSIQASNMRKITQCVMKVSEADKPIEIFKMTSFGKSLSNSDVKQQKMDSRKTETKRDQK